MVFGDISANFFYDFRPSMPPTSWTTEIVYSTQNCSNKGHLSDDIIYKTTRDNTALCITTIYELSYRIVRHELPNDC